MGTKVQRFKHSNDAEQEDFLHIDWIVRASPLTTEAKNWPGKYYSSRIQIVHSCTIAQASATLSVTDFLHRQDTLKRELVYDVLSTNLCNLR